MKAPVATLLLAVVLSAACAMEKTVGEEPRPEWVTALIRELESEPVANPPAQLIRYDYQGQAVYYLPPRCCDIPSNVYNATGAVICQADGGLRGDGDGRCPDFFTLRKDEKIIWRDPRGSK